MEGVSGSVPFGAATGSPRTVPVAWASTDSMLWEFADALTNGFLRMLVTSCPYSPPGLCFILPKPVSGR
jgi:hypothetical protein